MVCSIIPGMLYGFELDSSVCGVEPSGNQGAEWGWGPQQPEGPGAPVLCHPPHRGYEAALSQACVDDERNTFVDDSSSHIKN